MSEFKAAGVGKKNVKNTLTGADGWLRGSLAASLPSCKLLLRINQEGPKHNRCCLISEIIERQELGALIAQSLCTLSTGGTPGKN